MIEKVALALVLTARRMRPYFQNHEIRVKTNYPIYKILSKPDLAGRMIGWLVELSEFDIKYEPRGAIKSQCRAPQEHRSLNQMGPLRGRLFQ